MLLEIVEHNPGERLLSFFERAKSSGADWNALFFPSAKLPRALQQTDLLRIAKSVLTSHPYAVYIFHDGDMAIVWNGPQSGALEALLANFTRLFGTQAGTIGICYNFQSDGRGIRTLCERKIGTQSRLQIGVFRALAAARKNRRMPEILIVEDESFSSRLLLTMLERNYKTSIATNAESALETYLQMAPDIVFLDIELPGVNGDELAGMLTKLDPDAYIVMVTANSRLDDVQRCKKNGAKGFIAKPYSKQKILENIANFSRQYQPVSQERTVDQSVDLTNLREMTDGDVEVETALFEEFIASFDKAMESFRAAGTAPEAWQRTAHALKGISLNLGAAKLSALCKQAQDEAAGSADAKRSLLREIGSEYALVRTFLQKIIAA